MTAFRFLFPDDALCLFDRLLQHLDVHVNTDGIDEAGLFRSQHISCTADRKIAHRDLVSRTERCTRRWNRARCASERW